MITINLLSVQVNSNIQNDLEQKHQKLMLGSQKPDSLQKSSLLASMTNSVINIFKNIGILNWFK